MLDRGVKVSQNISDLQSTGINSYAYLNSNPYDKTNNLTLFSKKSEHVAIFDPCGTLKVNGSHLGNATICGISKKCCLNFY